VLDAVLGRLARQHDPNVLVGFDHADDAGVYRIDAATALVQTVDFFTPIVDDPFIFGQIAATNSLSDVYAMGGTPLTSLALVCFPEKGNINILEQILAGGLSKMMEAGCTVVGGHSIRDDETKFGYSVTGTIHPERILANKGSQVRDRLLFTKGIGTGVIATAIKKGTAKQAWIDAAIASMTTLNKTAAQVITRSTSGAGNEGASAGGNKQPLSSERPFHVRAMTDITGFGLIGHVREMALASDVGVRIFAGSIPLIPGALECVRANYIPGGLKANRDFAECVVHYEAGVPDELKTLLFDPQTAGGLVISVAQEDAADLLGALRAAGVPAAQIGEIVADQKPLIQVVP
jgi:selenide, water dikinase